MDFESAADLIFAMTSRSPSPPAHLELHTHDRAGASSFYRKLLGWRSEHVEAAGREYLALDLGSGLVGGNQP
jgi:predicted enzyme related to lactoylglutathione lyase